MKLKDKDRCSNMNLRLSPGDTIGIFSSSYPAAAEAPKPVERAISFLQQKGYQIKLGKLFGKQDYYRSGTIRQRAEEFNELLRDPEVTCMMAVAGGMVSNAILPYLDYTAAAEHPKIIVGHSDITALLLGIYQKAGLVTYYGPNLAADFGQSQQYSEQSLSYLEAVVSSQANLPYLCPIPPFYSDELSDWAEEVVEQEKKPNRWVTLRGGRAQGRLIGGNLNTISGIMGSPYMPEIRKGDILFLEDTEKFAAHAERYFSLLKLCGVLDRVGGIILGKHRKFDHQGSGRSCGEILTEVLGSREIPILADVDCCHTVPMLTLPIGGQVALDADSQEISLLSF